MRIEYHAEGAGRFFFFGGETVAFSPELWYNKKDGKKLYNRPFLHPKILLWGSFSPGKKSSGLWAFGAIRSKIRPDPPVFAEK